MLGHSDEIIFWNRVKTLLRDISIDDDPSLAEKSLTALLIQEQDKNMIMRQPERDYENLIHSIDSRIIYNEEQVPGVSTIQRNDILYRFKKLLSSLRDSKIEEQSAEDSSKKGNHLDLLFSGFNIEEKPSKHTESSDRNKKRKREDENNAVAAPDPQKEKRARTQK